MKTTLIIDGNYILHKNVFTLHKHNMLFGELHSSMERSFKSVKDKFTWDNIFFVSDTGRSWRKDILKEYKETRKTDNSIDWDFVYTAYDEFKDDLPKSVNVFEKSNIEGDDWIAYLTKIANENGHMCVILSNDSDIKQLLDFKVQDNLWINIMVNEIWGNEKIYLPKNYEIFLNKLKEEADKVNLFELSAEIEILDFIKKFIEKRDKNIVDNRKELIIKLISGDKSDNISSVFSKKTKSGKSRGIGKTSATKICEQFINENELNNLNLSNKELEELSEIICDIKNIEYNNSEKIKENLIFNRKLINFNYIPEKIISEMDLKIKKLQW